VNAVSTEVERLRAANELLRARVKELESALVEDFPAFSLSLTPLERTALSAILSRKIMSRHSFMVAAYAISKWGDPPHDAVVDQFILRLRKKLRPFGVEIKNRHGEGWFMTPEDKEKVRRLP